MREKITTAKHYRKISVYEFFAKARPPENIISSKKRTKHNKKNTIINPYDIFDRLNLATAKTYDTTT